MRLLDLSPPSSLVTAVDALKWLHRIHPFKYGGVWYIVEDKNTQEWFAFRTKQAAAKRNTEVTKLSFHG